MTDSTKNENLDDSEDIFIPGVDDLLDIIELDKNLFIGKPLNFNNFSMEEQIQDADNFEFTDKEYEEFEKNNEAEEQIDEIKINLFFILYHNCDYSEEYHSLINDKQIINSKRLVVQNYSINNCYLELGKKNYAFISPQTDKNNFLFKYGQNEIIVEKKKSGKLMKLNGDYLMSENEFIEKYGNIIKNIELIKIKKSKKKKSAKSMSGDKQMSLSNENNIKKDNNINDIISDKINENNDNNKIKEINENNNIHTNISEINVIINNKNNSDNNEIIKKDDTITQSSNKLSDSDKEIYGDAFYDDKFRYIFKDNYFKQIDGIFTKHNKIDINVEEKKLKDGLEELKLNKYNIENELFAHIIYKNFKEVKINENEKFILEVKKSMGELTDLLNQIKNISKVVKNIQNRELPKLIIGIICKVEEHQINLQKKILFPETLPENQIEKPIDHIMNIIKSNDVKVIICAIKDETILKYPLGIPDYDRNIGRKTRVDISYMNTFMKNLENHKVNEIFEKYKKKYKSLTLTRYKSENYDKLNKIYLQTLNDNKILKNKITQIEEEKDNTIKFLLDIMEKNGLKVNMDDISKRMNKK